MLQQQNTSQTNHQSTKYPKNQYNQTHKQTIDRQPTSICQRGTRSSDSTRFNAQQRQQHGEVDGSNPELETLPGPIPEKYHNIIDVVSSTTFRSPSFDGEARTSTSLDHARPKKHTDNEARGDQPPRGLRCNVKRKVVNVARAFPSYPLSVAWSAPCPASLLANANYPTFLLTITDVKLCSSDTTTP